MNKSFFNHRYTFVYYFTICLIILDLLNLTACTKNPVDPVPNNSNPSPACRLIASTSSYQNRQTYESWQYDNLGREKIYQLVSVNSSPTSPSQDTTVTESFYDSNDYLIRKISKIKYSQFEKPSILTLKYTYNSGRLVKSDLSGSTQTYEYDGLGNLTKSIHSFPFSNGMYTNVYLYRLGKQIDFYQQDPNGQITRTYFFENGLRSSIVNSTLITKLQYDNQGRFTHSDDYEDNQLIQYTDITYKEGIHPNMMHYYPKGWPKEMQFEQLGWNTYEGLNIRIVNNYLNPLNGQFYVIEESTTTYQLNSSGLPIRSETSQKTFDRNGKLFSTTPLIYTYTFDNCP